MDIHWATLVGVCGVSLGITLLTVVLFSLGIAAWPRGDGGGGGGERAHGANRTATAAAVLCFGACLAVAVYGLTLIIGA
ncbi:hypothetical protein HEP84_46695 [Streptomyces sp. RLB1-33]|nr:hypothetical protein [Streptomyces sp. RLB1-33]QIY75428.1 hypothetical protein HEP84_46695 [Streptomyces sp. RLB1-33]